MDNFFDTAERVYQSAKTLHDNEEFHNACYLSGYVVECYAKLIIQQAYSTDSKDIKISFGHNLKEMNKELKYLLNDSSIHGLIPHKYFIQL